MLNNITLYNYRNIDKSAISLTEQANILIAPNGYGKTNLIESIYYSIFRNSFRPLHSYEELMGKESDFTKIELEWFNNDLITTISNKDRLSRKTVLNNKKALKRSILEKFPLILFAPHSVDLVNGEPKIRRDDFDSFIQLVKPGFLNQLNEYNTVLRNRNALLKALREGFSSKKELYFWTEKLVKLSSEISRIRQDYINKVNEIVPRLSQEMYHDIDNLKINYIPNVNNEGFNNFTEAYSTKFIENEEKEIVVGKTLYGSHKDDYEFSFRINNSTMNLKFHGSRGQQRIGSFLFKMGQLQILEETNDVPVLLLLDDIMSELDNIHRENIAAFLLNKKNQLLLTGADKNEIPNLILKKSKVIKLK